MRFSEKWLREWVSPAVSTEELVAQLTMAGLEVDAVEPAAGDFQGVVVAEVLSAEPHPDADKLNVCSVNAGAGEPLQIVCGAPNVRAGMFAPLATVGGVMPGGFKIKKAKLRGVESFGMLCSAKELGLSEAAEGLLEFPSDAPVGADIRDYLGLDDQCIEVDLTPNRGDCLGVAGIAREVGVLNRAEVSGVEAARVAEESERRFPVTVTASAACPRYLGRVIEGIDPKAQTPIWMQEKLRRSGIRSLGPGVDVTNFVLLELGQPMHAFDLAQLNAGIDVRFAGEAEQMTLLDGKEIQLTTDTLVIADQDGPVALAGIMGGERSGMADDTRDIFLECAFFSPLAIAGKARRYGLHTDSSHRFERGVDPQLQALAMARATALLLDIVGGKAGPVVEVCSEADLPARSPIHLRRERIRKVLGLSLDDADIIEMLERLGMQVEGDTDGWNVLPPSFRFDMSIEVDLIEELGRIYGYERIPNVLPQAAMTMPASTESQRPRGIIKSMLVERGYQEVVTYAFIEPAIQSAMEPEAAVMTLANPLSQDMSVMRTSLLPGLINTLKYNQNRQAERVRIFEMGMVFLKNGDELLQHDRIAGLLWGSAEPAGWQNNKPRRVDFFDLKADLESLLAAVPGQATFVAGEHPSMHPGQCAQVSVDGRVAGYIGVLHPSLEQSLDVSGRPVLFELDLTALSELSVPSYRALSKFPSIRRDLAFVVAEQVSAGELVAACQSAGGERLIDVQLFDVYQGDNVENGLKSIALGLILQDSSATLTDEAVTETVDAVVASLGEKFAARLRD